MINFIGIGAQKSGTSWVHACLFEHSEICSPVKEIHFFSRDRFSKGKEWYEQHFAKCDEGTKCGEFSTSYLHTPGTAERIACMYPEVRLIAILREPAERAYSQYRNAIKAGEIEEDTVFEKYLQDEKSCIEQGCYTEQLARYYKHFRKGQVLVMIYEDLKSDPLAFIQAIYRHIGVDDSFVPPSLEKEFNIARTPKNVGIDSVMHKIAEWLRKHGASHFVHVIKSSGLTDFIRSLNTKADTKTTFDTTPYKKYFNEDVTGLSKLIGRDVVSEWNYTHE